MLVDGTMYGLHIATVEQSAFYHIRCVLIVVACLLLRPGSHDGRDHVDNDVVGTAAPRRRRSSRSAADKKKTTAEAQEPATATTTVRRKMSLLSWYRPRCLDVVVAGCAARAHASIQRTSGRGRDGIGLFFRRCSAPSRSSTTAHLSSSSRYFPEGVLADAERRRGNGDGRFRVDAEKEERKRFEKEEQDAEGKIRQSYYPVRR